MVSSLTGFLWNLNLILAKSLTGLRYKWWTLNWRLSVIAQKFSLNYFLFKITLSPSKKVEFPSEKQKDMSDDGSWKRNNQIVMMWHASFKRNNDTCGTSHWSSTCAVISLPSDSVYTESKSQLRWWQRGWIEWRNWKTIMFQWREGVSQSFGVEKRGKRTEGKAEINLRRIHSTERKCEIAIHHTYSHDIVTSKLSSGKVWGLAYYVQKVLDWP